MPRKFIPINGGKALRSILDGKRWMGRFAARMEFKPTVTPESFARRFHEENSSRTKNLESYRNWIFANHVRYLRLSGHIEVRKVAGKIELRLTEKGLKYKHDYDDRKQV